MITALIVQAEVAASAAIPAKSLTDNAKEQVGDLKSLLTVAGVVIAIGIALAVWIKVRTASAVIMSLLVGGAVNWGIANIDFLKNSTNDQLKSESAVVYQLDHLTSSPHLTVGDSNANYATEARWLG